MRRANRGRGSITPDELAALYAQVKTEAAGMHPRAASRHIRDTLAQVGTDPLEALVARYWIRRGRPRDYLPAVIRGWTRV